MSRTFVTWTREELIVALDLYRRRGARIPADHPDVIMVSDALRGLPFPRNQQLNPRYRSPDAVHLKLQNFLAIDPQFSRKAMAHGARGDRAVFDDFASDSERLSALAGLIVATVRSGNVGDDARGDDPDDVEFPEGRILFGLHRRYERDRSLAGRARKRHIRLFGTLFCEACAFDFAQFYGERGESWIEVHHDVPVSTLSPNGATKLSDLRLLCSNCHRMIHRKRPWLTVDELRRVINSTPDFRRQQDSIERARTGEAL